ncbi:hypothetical protein [Corynebacterium silvaticum]|uniref:Uncharacterized protein n=1 Tax=Corynebacterium silvaticum TaxID=2320431 RepID=A0A7Y4UPJ3_9CORY|nr:hypothetical protein [Corynebacterium silvaticum]ARU45323.2 hypothetical protein CBE74_00990 [Corynebacterium silvaticum]
MSATVLFQTGFTLRKVVEGREDPITGEPGSPTITEIVGRGLVQEPLWSSEKEVGPTSVKDERLIMFCPVSMGVSDVVVTAADEVEDPRGQVWQCITDGHERGIPGQAPEYVAVRVRRAKGKR